MTKRRKRFMGTIGLVFMSIIAAVIGVVIGGALVVGIVQLYAST